jgi:hypothetical protein
MNTYVRLGLQLNGRRAFRNGISDYKFEKKTVSSRLDDVHATSLGPPPTTSRLQPAGPTWKKKE